MLRSSCSPGGAPGGIPGSDPGCVTVTKGLKRSCRALSPPGGAAAAALVTAYSHSSSLAMTFPKNSWSSAGPCPAERGCAHVGDKDTEPGPWIFWGLFIC